MNIEGSQFESKFRAFSEAVVRGFTGNFKAFSARLANRPHTWDDLLRPRMKERKKPRDSDLITQREAAALIGRSVRFLQIREREGNGPANRPEGRERIYSRAGVLAWARQHNILPE